MITKITIKLLFLLNLVLANEVTIGRLCDNLTFTHIGNAFVAELSGLGVTAFNGLTNQTINKELSSVCITIPEYYIGTASEASTNFIAIANSGRDKIPLLLNSDQLYPSSFAMRDKLKQLITDQLQGQFPGSSFV